MGASVVDVPSAIPFVRWTIQNAQDAIALPAALLASLRVARDLYRGNHWLDGAGWIGPWPMPPEGASKDELLGTQELQVEIKRGFTPRNAIAEVIERHATGTTGIEPRWTFTADGVDARALVPQSIAPTPDEQAAIDAAKAKAAALKERVDRLNSLVTKWWDQRGVHQIMLKLCRSLLYGTISSLRLYIPPNMLVDEQQNGRKTGRKLLRILNVEDAFDKIHIEVLDADEGRVVAEQQTLADVGVKPWKRGEQTVVDLTYLDEQRRTVIATIDGNNRPSVTLDLGGRLVMKTVTRDTFITPEVIASQKALNFANSMIPRNVQTSGFLSEVILNAKVPGHWEEIDGRRKFIGDPIMRGAGALNVWQGHELEDAQGNKTMTTPDVKWRDPVDPTPTIKAKREHYSDVLEECDQAHILISGDATASGKSREEARGDHVSSMGLTRAPVEDAGRWLLETVVVLAEALASSAASSGSVLAELRASFTCYLFAGQISAAERQQNSSDVKQGTLSRATAIERGGIVDVDMELQRIRDEQAHDLDVEIKRAAVFKAWIDAGVSDLVAAQRAGLSADEAKALLEGQTDVTPPKPKPVDGGDPALDDDDDLPTPAAA